MNDTLDLDLGPTRGAPSPSWERAKARLVKDGRMDEQAVTRTPKPRRCRRCGAPVIAAIDDIGLTVACHPHPTTAAGELEALMTSSHPAGVTFTNLGDRLVYRAARIIKRYSCDEYDVLVIHECGKPAPPINPKRIPAPRKEEHNDQPPF